MLVNVPGVVPAVNRPARVDRAAAGDDRPVGVIATTLPLASLPTAVNCCVRADVQRDRDSA